MVYLRKYRLNTRAVVRIIGLLLIVESIFMSVPLGVSLAYGEADSLSFAISIAITAICGVSAYLLSKPRRRELGRREGILLTSLVWVVFSFFGMLPFIFSSVNLNVTQGFFEAMSGFTTTGASVLSDIENLPSGIHMWRSLMQWIGGMGIIIFTVALLPMFNSSGGMQMFFAEATGITHDKLRPRVSQTAKRLWLIYTLLTVILCILLWIGPMNFFDSVCHAFSTISTGGFSTSNDSLGAWSSFYIKIVVLVFMFIGGVNFGLLYKASTGKVKLVWRDEIFRAYLWIVICVAVFFAIMIVMNGAFSNIGNLIVDPLFQVVSTITSTGYSIADFSSWGDAIFPILFILMFIGACAGSTSGGAKVDRILFLWKNSRNELNKNIHPSRFYPLSINGRTCSHEMLSKIMAFIFIYLVLVMMGAIAVALTGIPLGDSFFAAFSCIGNTGLGSGVTSASYNIIPDFGKWILSLLMLIGRLEIFTVLILLARGFWKK